MKFRPQRGGLDQSMSEMVELPATYSALETYLGAKRQTVNVSPYCYDDRTGWKTYIITVDGQAVGFTDGPCLTE